MNKIGFFIILGELIFTNLAFADEVSIADGRAKKLYQSLEGEVTPKCNNDVCEIEATGVMCTSMEGFNFCSIFEPRSLSNRVINGSKAKNLFGALSQIIEKSCYNQVCTTGAQKIQCERVGNLLNRNYHCQLQWAQ